MMDGDEFGAFAATAAAAVAACRGLSVAEAAARLAGDGLIGVMAAEAAGGVGLGLAHAVPVMRAAGAGLLGFPLLEAMLVARACGAAVPGVVAGGEVATIAWAGGADLSGGTVSGVVGRAPAVASAGLVLVALGEGAALLRVGPGVTVRAAIGLDVDVPEGEVVAERAVPVALLDAGAWAALRADARLLWAAAIAGSAETCLSLAVEHAGTREQFGKTLVSFQALRHALARQKLAVEHIDAALVRVGMLLADSAEGRLAADAAYAAAVRFGAAAVENSIQVHGGMGFTWDMPMHRHLRRIRAWEAQGDSAGLHRALAAAMLAGNA